jgi:hypothetical protein
MPPAPDEASFLSPLVRRLVVGLLLITGLGIRLYRIPEWPLDFHPTRQYRSLLLASAYYQRSLPDAEPQDRELAETRLARINFLEPPIMEFIACGLYHMGGGENARAPRIFASFMWVAAGVLLYLLAAKTAGADGALLALAFYLFAPFGLTASTSFQPDPLMVSLIIAAVWAMWHHWERPSRLRLVLVVVLGAAAIFVKPTALFFVYGGWAGCVLSAWRGRRIRSWVRTLAPFFLFILPAGVYFAACLVGDESTSLQARNSVMPHLWGELTYWRRWLQLACRVIGGVPLCVAVASLALFPRGPGRGIVLGLWGGYLLYGLVFSYHIHTHNYYHLPLIPVVAVTLAAPGTVVMGRLRDVGRRWSGGLALFAAALIGIFFSVDAARDVPSSSRIDQMVAEARRIGEAVNHSTRTIFLAAHYGKPLQYHGGIYGLNWPWSGDVRAERLRGERVPSAAERLEELRAQIDAEYFIVAHGRQFREQTELRELLSSNYPILARDPGFLVFDLRAGAGR